MASRHKRITAFLADGSIVVDRKAYLKTDFIVSDKHKWLAPPLKPTKTYAWRKEGSRPSLQGTEYVLTSAPAPPDHNNRLIETLSKIWEEALGGKRVRDRLVSDSYMLQIVVALAGAVLMLLMVALWYMVSQSYELPPIPEGLMPEVPVNSPADPGGGRQ